MPTERSAEEIVRAKWPDAGLMTAFATQKDGTRKSDDAHSYSHHAHTEL